MEVLGGLSDRQPCLIQVDTPILGRM